MQFRLNNKGGIILKSRFYVGIVCVIIVMVCLTAAVFIASARGKRSQHVTYTDTGIKIDASAEDNSANHLVYEFDESDVPDDSDESTWTYIDENGESMMTGEVDGFQSYSSIEAAEADLPFSICRVALDGFEEKDIEVTEDGILGGYTSTVTYAADDKGIVLQINQSKTNKWGYESDFGERIRDVSSYETGGVEYTIVRAALDDADMYDATVFFDYYLLDIKGYNVSLDEFYQALDTINVDEYR